MSNVQISSFFSLATASAIAISICGAYSEFPKEEVTEKLPSMVQYHAIITNPSNESIKITPAQADPYDLESRISSFYNSFSAEQKDLEPEYEAALLANLSSLYED